MSCLGPGNSTYKRKEQLECVEIGAIFKSLFPVYYSGKITETYLTENETINQAPCSFTC